MKNTIKKMGLGMVAFGMLSSMPMNSYAVEKTDVSLSLAVANEVDDSVVTDDEKEQGILSNGFVKYKEIENNEIEIVKFIEKDGDVTIPKEIEGKKVTVLGTMSYANLKEEIPSVEIFQSNIKTLGSSVFHGSKIKGDVDINNDSIVLSQSIFESSTISGDVNISGNVDIGNYSFLNTIITGNVNITLDKSDVEDNSFYRSEVKGDLNINNSNDTQLGSSVFTFIKVGGNVIIEDSKINSNGDTFLNSNIKGNFIISNSEFKDSGTFFLNGIIGKNLSIDKSKLELQDSGFQNSEVGNFSITNTVTEFGNTFLTGSIINGDFNFKNNRGRLGRYGMSSTEFNGNFVFDNFVGNSDDYLLSNSNVKGDFNYTNNNENSVGEYSMMSLVVEGNGKIENSQLYKSSLLRSKFKKLDLKLDDKTFGNNLDSVVDGSISYVAQEIDVGKLNLYGQVTYLPTAFFLGSRINTEGDDLDIKLDILDVFGEGNHLHFLNAYFGGNVIFSGKINKIPSRFMLGTITKNPYTTLRFLNNIDYIGSNSFTNNGFSEINFKSVDNFSDNQNISGDKLNNINFEGDVGNIPENESNPFISGQVNVKIDGNLSSIGGNSLDSLSGEYFKVLGNVGQIKSNSLANGGIKLFHFGGDVDHIERLSTNNMNDSKIFIGGDVKLADKDSIKNAKHINIEGTVKNNPDGFGFSENGFVEFNIGKGIENIYEGMFSNSLNKDNQDLYIDLPKNILTGNKIVEDNAFKDGAFKGELNFTDTNHKLGNSSFENNKFTKLNLSNSLTELPMNVFKDNDITVVKLPKGLKTIHEGALSNNKIACVTLPRGLDKIEPSALKQKDNVVIDVYAKKDKGYEELFKDLPYINFKEDNVFTNECEDNTWGVSIKHITTDGEVLKEENIDKPKEQTMVINSEKFDGYELQGESKQEITISDETPSHDVVFTYAKEKPPVIVPPTEEKPEIKPPVIVPPVEGKPEIKPPVVVPPVEEKPEIKPPVTVPPVEEKPEIKPPVIVPPVEEKPEVEPPVIVPPVEEKPEVEPEEDLPTDNLILGTDSEIIDGKEETDKPILNETKEDTTDKKDDKVTEELPKTGSEDTSYGLVGFMMMLVSFIFFGRKKKSDITNID